MATSSKKQAKRRRVKRWFRMRKRPGVRPGTVEAPANAPPTRIRAIAYDRERITEVEITDLNQVPPLLEQWSVVWINIDGLGDAATIQKIGEMFQIHILALEDVVNVHQRAKVEPYENQLYVVVRVPNDDREHPTEQISLFLGRNFVLTFQEFPGDCFDPIRVRMRNQQSEIRKGCQADYLAYRLIDSLVDSYFPVLEKLGDRLDDLDELLIQSPKQGVFTQIHGLKGELQMLRRAAWPLRDALGSLMRDPTELVSDSTRVYWRDCYDHSVQIIDLVETYREVCADLRDFYLSSISNRMNEIMKVLTVIATLFIPLTFIVGVYGMNFEYMPELKWRWGYPTVWIVMLTIAAGLVAFFWRKGWLGKNGDQS